jgi:hypothetical protein
LSPQQVQGPMRLKLFGSCGKLYAMLSMIGTLRARIEVKFGRRNSG